MYLPAFVFRPKPKIFEETDEQFEAKVAGVLNPPIEVIDPPYKPEKEPTGFFEKKLDMEEELKRETCSDLFRAVTLLTEKQITNLTEVSQTQSQPPDTPIRSEKYNLHIATIFCVFFPTKT